MNLRSDDMVQVLLIWILYLLVRLLGLLWEGGTFYTKVKCYLRLSTGIGLFNQVQVGLFFFKKK